MGISDPTVSTLHYLLGPKSSIFAVICLLQSYNGKNNQIFLTSQGFSPYRAAMSTDFEFHADREIASQPEIWRKTAAFAPSVSHLLPKPGERIAVVGCGSSWFMSQAYASLREAAGQGESHYFTASEYI